MLIVLLRSLQKLQNAPRYVRVCGLTGRGTAPTRDEMGSTAGGEAGLWYILLGVLWAHRAFISKSLEALFCQHVEI